VPGHRLLAPIALAALATPSLLASTADAATLALSAPCFLESSTITAAGQGWDAGKTVSVSDPQSHFYGSATADAAGNFVTTFRAPLLPTIKPAVVAYVASASEFSNPALTAQVPFAVTNARVDAKLSGNPRSKVRFSISGFPGGSTVYGHWVFARRARANVKMGVVPQPCGIVRRKVRRIPATLRSGLWTIQFDTNRRYSAKTQAKQVLKIRIFKSFRFHR
jgi:hypothetical protein